MPETPPQKKETVVNQIEMMHEEQPTPKKNGHGKKKWYLPVILISTVILILYCICCWFILLPPFRTIESVLTYSTPTAGLPDLPQNHPTVAARNLSKCTTILSQLDYQSNHSWLTGEELDKTYDLVTYQVNGDTISDPYIPGYLAEKFQPYQQDTAAHELLWKFVVDIVPGNVRRDVVQFVITTDGVNNNRGAVQQVDAQFHWQYKLDIQDAYLFQDLSTTVVHELAHLVTLSNSQIEISTLLYFNRNNQDVVDHEDTACFTYFTQEGCSRAESYINTFYNTFWQDIYDEWKAIQTEEDEDTLVQQLDSFYLKFFDQFVSRYAVTSAKEDIAESFVHFIFEPKPFDRGIADKKILFFYDYPELVTLREYILEHLCSYVEW